MASRNWFLIGALIVLVAAAINWGDTTPRYIGTKSKALTITVDVSSWQMPKGVSDIIVTCTSKACGGSP